MTHPSATGPLPRHVRVAVVGSGFSGIGMTVRLLQQGIDDVVVLERADSLGGTWRDNTYPGAACDVPSHLYSFSFAPNPDWSHAFSRAAEIRAYLEAVAARFGVLPHLHCGTDLLAGTWDDDALLWRLSTSKGDLTADVVVSGCGGLVEPALPDVPGVETFAGPAFHSARWDHDVDLTGKQVAVVGTGASAVQFVPEIAPQVARLVVFQRTPPWIVPRMDRAYSGREKDLFGRFPLLLRASRTAKYWLREGNLWAFTGAGRLRAVAQREALRHLARQVADPALRDRLTPRYDFGCKRVLISNDYYPALVRGNVEVVDAAVREVRPRGVVDATGREHEVDVIVYGTGFRVMDIPVASRLTGREGRTLAQQWQDGGAQAHRGTTVAGFPNLFLLLGPNTALGHSSVVFMIEAQIDYVMGALRTLDRQRTRALEVRREAQDSFNAELQAQLGDTVWNTGGCRSWYRDAQGRNFTLWPTHTFTFRSQTRRFDAEAYRLRPAGSTLQGRERSVRTADGVALHVEEHGPVDAAATFVLTHGYTQASSLWEAQVRHLAARSDLRVVVFDHRGHGRSGRTPRAAATLEQLGRDLAAVVEATAPSGPLLLGGHSMGGMALMAFAEQHPDVVRERLAGVAFVGTSAGGLADVGWGLPRPLGRLANRLLPALNAVAWKLERRGRPRTQLARVEAFVTFGRGADPADVRAVLDVQKGCSAETVHLFLGTFSDHDRAHALGLLAQVPAVVLVGERDRICPAEHSRTIAAALPRAELTVYPGAGHMVHLERREQVGRQLVRLVERALDEPYPAASASRAASRDTPLTSSSSPRA